MRRATIVPLLLGMMLAGSNARADWPSSPTLNVLVSTASTLDAAVTDGRGGMIVIWQDQSYRLLAQRIDAVGSARWTPGGVVVCTGTGSQTDAHAFTDGAGGVLLMWSDGRSGGIDLYAQRIGANGNRLWSDAGVPLCTGTQVGGVAAATDEHGGLLVVWQDGRDGGPKSNLFAQSIDPTGTTRWAENGGRITSGGVEWQTAAIAPDDSSGAIVTWHDFAVNTVHAFAQRLDAVGQLRWGGAGVQMGGATHAQVTPRITRDGAGGAFIVWADDNGSSNTTTAQHLDATGTPLWSAKGIPLGPVSGDQQFQSPILDGAGGVVVVWTDLSTTAGWAQRVTASGSLLWTASGVPLAPAHLGNFLPIVHPQPDGSGGVLASWTDYRTGDGDLYVEHLNSSGTATWTADGVPVCTGPGYDVSSQLIADGGGGLLVAWSGYRDATGWGVYAQNVTAAGALGGSTTAVPGPEPTIDFALHALGAEPHRGELAVECSLPGMGTAMLRLLDVSGRCIEQRALGGSGVQRFRRNATALTPGVYVLQLAQGNRSTARRIVWLR